MKTEKLILICSEETQFDLQNDKLTTLIKHYQPMEELSEEELSFVSAARGQMSYEQFLQMAKEKTIKK